MRAALLAVALLAGCASVPSSDEYQVPPVTLDDKLEVKTTRAEPGDTGRLLVCIEFTDGVLCISEDHGTTARFFIPYGAP